MNELGGWSWEPAVLGAELHFIRAMRMGGKWVQKDNMSSLTMVLRMEPQYQEIHDEKWSRFTKFHKEKKTQAIAGEGGPPPLMNEEEEGVEEPVKKKVIAMNLRRRQRQRQMQTEKAKATTPTKSNRAADDKYMTDEVDADIEKPGKQKP